MDEVEGLPPPVNIAEVVNKYEVKRYGDRFQAALNKARGKKILIVQVLGNYQQGKTSTISLITGNAQHQIGNGYKEQTKGVWIDGPYTIQYIAKRFGISGFENIPDDNSIFFIDCEGAGGFNLPTAEQNNNLMRSLDIPYSSVASCVVYPVNLNENIQSIENVASILNFKNFSTEIEPNFTESLVLIPLYKNVIRLSGIGSPYENPTENLYRRFSQGLEDLWAERNLMDDKYNICPRPLPLFQQGLGIFDQNENFYKGFKLFVKDLLEILTRSLRSNFIHDSQATYDVYCRTIEKFQEVNFDEWIKSSRLTATMQTLKRLAQSCRVKYINEFKDNLAEFIDDLKSNNSLDIDRINLFHDANNQAGESLFTEKFPEQYLQENEIKEEINLMHKEIDDLIEFATKQLIYELSPNLIKDITFEFSEHIDSKLQEFTSSISTKEGYVLMKRQLNEYLENTKKDFEQFKDEKCKENAKKIQNIEQLMNSQFPTLWIQFKRAVDDKMATQELLFTRHDPNYTHEPDPNDPDTIVYYVQDVTIHPDGTREEGEKREMNREKKLHMSSSRDETRSRIEGDRMIVEKRRIVEKDDGTTQIGEWELIGEFQQNTQPPPPPPPPQPQGPSPWQAIGLGLISMATVLGSKWIKHGINKKP